MKQRPWSRYCNSRRLKVTEHVGKVHHSTAHSTDELQNKLHVKGETEELLLGFYFTLDASLNFRNKRMRTITWVRTQRGKYYVWLVYTPHRMFFSNVLRTWDYFYRLNLKFKAPAFLSWTCEDRFCLVLAHTGRQAVRLQPGIIPSTWRFCLLCYIVE